MTNNKDRKSELTPAQELRRQEIERLAAEKTYRGLMDDLGLSNTSYLSDFVKWGIIPSNKQIADAMGIPKRVSKGARVYRALSEKAKAAGWESWSEFCTAVLNGETPITSKVVAAYYRPRYTNVVIGNIRLLDVGSENYGQTGKDDEPMDPAGSW